MKEMRNKNKQIFISLLVSLMLVFTMIPTSVVYADASYDFQPEGADNTANSLKMLEPSNISFISTNGSYYVNQINEVIDGTKDEGIKFTFTMSAGMNNFNKEWFLEKNMPLIKIYDEKEEQIVAQYSDGNGDLKFHGSHLTEDINNHGTYKTDEFYIGVDKGVLGTGDYVIVFGAGICGNNADKIFGQDIKFRFSVKAAPELSEMIAQTKAFLENVEVSETEAGGYPQAAVDEINAALETAESYTGDNPDAEADVLYEALKAFKGKKIVAVNGITISGMPDTVYVGDTGKALSLVSVIPDEDQYKKVTWSVIEEPKEVPEDEVPAGNLIAEELTGKWIAAYSGTVYLKATSTKDPTKAQYQKVEITSEEGVIAVNLADKDTRVQELMAKALSESGTDISSVTSVKVFTTGTGAMTDEDISYLNSIKSLKTLNLKKTTLSQLPNAAFKNHPALEEIYLPDTLTSIGQQAFYGCSRLKNLAIPASVTSFGGGAFAGCTALDETMVIHAVYPPTYTVTGYYGDTYDGADGDVAASVTTIQVPYGCSADYKAKQGWRAFNIVEAPRQPLEVSFMASGTLAEKAEAVLAAKGIPESEVTDLIITSPEGVQLSRSDDINGYLQTHFLYATTIDLSGTEFEDNKCNANTFKDRISMKYIYLPDSTNTLGGTCFSGCKNLREFTIPESVVQIGSGAFSGCVLLGDSIACDAAEPPNFDGTIFPSNITTIYVPAQSVDAYKEASGWSSYRDNIKPRVSIALNKTSLSLEAPATSSLTAAVSIYNGDPDDVTVFWQSSNPSVATVSASTGKTVTVKGLKAGTATITAKDVTGNVRATCKVTVKAMAAPATVKAASAAYNKIKVTWTGVTGAQKYQVFRCNSKGTALKSWTLSSTARSFTDTGLTTGTTYYYKVRAYKTVSKVNYYGSYSALKSAKPLLSKPGTPTVSRYSSKYVKVKWKGISGESGYQVYRATSKTGKYTKVASVKMTGYSYPYAKIKATKGKTYYYKVRAYKNVGSKPVYSSFSNPKAYKLK